MKVAAQAQRKLSLDPRLQLSQPLPIDCWIEVIVRIRVRCAYNVRDAVFGGHLRHCHSRVQVFCAVVQPEQQVMMNVDHEGTLERFSGPRPANAVMIQKSSIRPRSRAWLRWNGRD